MGPTQPIGSFLPTILGCQKNALIAALKGKIIFDGPVESLIGQVVAEEITFLNGQLGFPVDFEVLIETCEEANAFYDPEAGSVSLCAEFETYLSRQYENM